MYMNAVEAKHRADSYYKNKCKGAAIRVRMQISEAIYIHASQGEYKATINGPDVEIVIKGDAEETLREIFNDYEEEGFIIVPIGYGIIEMRWS